MPTVTVSDIDVQALAEINAEKDTLKTAVWTWLRDNPTATQAQLEAYVESYPDEYPDNKFGVKDRLTLLGEYISNAGGYAKFVGLMAYYPLDIVLQIAPELGKPLPTLGTVAYYKMSGNMQWGYLGKGAPDFVQYVSERYPSGWPMVEIAEGGGVTVSRMYAEDSLDADWQVI